MATKKYKIQQLQSDETLLTLHPETDASIVQVDKSVTGTTATNVQAAIKELKDEIKSTADEVKDGVVTGVKGENETNFRKGQVTITKANIGLGNVNNTSDADKPISTAVQAALDTVVQIAEGKTKTYVISASVNFSFASNEDTIKLSMQGTNITTTTGQTSIRLSELKLGDIVLLTDTDYPDRWVSTINGDLMWFDKLETRKIDLSGYATTSDLDSYLPLSGGVMSGDLNMGSMDIINVANIEVGQDITVGDSQTYVNIDNQGVYVEDEESRDFSSLDSHKLNFNNRCNVDEDGINSAYGGWGFNDASEPTLLNKAGRFIQIATDSFDGNYNEYYFPEQEGTVALTSNVTGSYSAVQVTNGIVTGGAQMFEVGVTNQTEPSANLAIGGIFFKEI